MVLQPLGSSTATDVVGGKGGVLVHTAVPQGQLSSSRAEIALSWTRSRMNGLREDDEPCLVLEEVDAEGGLVRAAGRALRQAAAELDGSPVALVLTDHAARIVDFQCAAGTIRGALRDLGIARGVCLGEDVIGTNALGTPAEIRQGVLSTSSTRSSTTAPHVARIPTRPINSASPAWRRPSVSTPSTWPKSC